MAIFADVIDEWKKASGKEKLLIAGGGAAVVALALYLHSKSSSQSQPTGTGTTGVGGSFQQAAPGATGSTGTTSTTATPGTGLPPPQFLGPPQKVGTGTVRASGLFPGWDASHTGVPIRSAPGGSIIGYAPWQSVLQIFGSTSGPSNQFGDPSAAGQGSTTWYQVYFNGIQAFVSAADIGLNEQPLASTANVSAPSHRVQPNTTMNVYANTRHSPSVVPIRTLQAPPGPPARAQ